MTEDDSTPLHKACAGSKPGHLAAVKLLLDGEADVHALNKWRETPLLTAANHGQAGAVDSLLRYGADPRKCTDTGWSPLSIAAYKGHDEVVRLLLDADAPTEEDDPTLSALLQAATKGLPATVELLLRHGADHTVTTKKGDTALSILVEQHLIDAAVDMVTDYNASIQRCSRDRKKVQRARLLISHRIKQMEKEGKRVFKRDDDDDDETDGDTGLQLTAQHAVVEDSAQTDPEKQTKTRRKESKESAETKARLAEEALLKELEQEELQAKKEEKEASSKRDKKRKKKEKERQLKEKEEEERREREQLQALERDRARKAKEEQQRKENELRLKEQREREVREAMEHARLLNAKRKEQERREREQAKLKESESTATGSSHDSDRHNKSKGLLNGQNSSATHSGKPSSASKPSISSTQKAPVPAGRRWETKPVPMSLARKDVQDITSLSNTTLKREPASAIPMLVPLHVISSSNSTDSSIGIRSAVANGSDLEYNADYVEHPAIALFRREKVTEMLQRCKAVASVVSENIVQRVIYRWVVRAAHDSPPYIDPLIPSWQDVDSLVSHFQRQFIAESRRTGSSANMEALKDAGASVASLCLRLAQEVEQFRQHVSSRLPADWSDADLGMVTEDAAFDDESCVSLAWSNRSSLIIPLRVVRSLRARHVGLRTRFLTSVFVLKVWYETLGVIADGTVQDVCFPSITQSVLASEACISGQLWSDPFSVIDGSACWGKLAGVDRMFGVKEPFAKDGSRSWDFLATVGGALSVVSPLDNAIASRYVKVMLDLLQTTTSSNVPLSFLVVIPAECFPSNLDCPGPNDLHLIDSRLGESGRSFLQHVECLEPGQHFFHICGKGSRSISPRRSLLVLLQNPGGRVRFCCSKDVLFRIKSSFSTVVPPLASVNNRMISPIGGVSAEIPVHARESPRALSGSYFNNISAVSPEPPQSDAETFPGGLASFPSAPFASANEVITRAPRRGRLFELEDNIIDEDQASDDYLVSGMLNGLNGLDMGLFQNNTITSDDIQAISLMGIGEGKSPTLHHPDNHQGPSFSTHFR